MNTLTINTLPIPTKLVTWGSDNNPLLICLHGLGGTPLSFHELALTLEDHFHIIAPYIPGSGGTQEFMGDDGYSMPPLVEWLHNVINLVANRPIYLLSHSWGAHIGLYLQNSYPEVVKKHLMLDGGYYLRLPHQESIEVLEQDIQDQIDSDNSYNFDDSESYLEEEKNDVNHWNESMRLAAMDRMIERNGKLYWHLSNEMTAQAFRGIYHALPSDIYHSLMTQGIEHKNRLLMATLPESKTERQTFASTLHSQTGIPFRAVKHAGHSIHLDQPDIVTQEVLQFFV